MDGAGAEVDGADDEDFGADADVLGGFEVLGTEVDDDGAEAEVCGAEDDGGGGVVAARTIASTKYAAACHDECGNELPP